MKWGRLWAVIVASLISFLNCCYELVNDGQIISVFDAFLMKLFSVVLSRAAKWLRDRLASVQYLETVEGEKWFLIKFWSLDFDFAFIFLWEILIGTRLTFQWILRTKTLKRAFTDSLFWHWVRIQQWRLRSCRTWLLLRVGVFDRRIHVVFLLVLPVQIGFRGNRVVIVTTATLSRCVPSRCHYHLEN